MILYIYCIYNTIYICRYNTIYIYIYIYIGHDTIKSIISTWNL